MTRRLFAFILFIALVAAGQDASAKTDIEFILDASGSMRAAMGGSTQIEVAKQSIKTALDALPPDAFVALRVYGHRVEQTDKAASCVDSELMIPFGPLNKALVASRVDSIQPKGYTPIAFSLDQAANDFGVERESEHVLVLVSDGEETCGGDPVKAVQGLIAKGFKVKVHAVGFNVDAKTQAQLTAIAQAGGGQYYDARDPQALAGSLQEIAQKSFLVQKTNAVYGSEIKGGDSYETAVPLPPGQEFHLNHHQRKNQFDYFYVDLKAGQGLVVSMNTLGKGVSIRGEAVQENASPYAGFQIHDMTRNKVGGDEIIGSANKTQTEGIDAPMAGRYFVLIGSGYDDMHKDHPFKVEVKDFFDAGTTTDAGAVIEMALPIRKGQSYPSNYLTSGDAADVFKIPTSAGESVVLQILPENMKSRLRATLYDDLRVELVKANSPNDGAGIRLSGTATGPNTYVKIERYISGASTKYSMTFEGASVPATMPASAPETAAAPTTMPVATPETATVPPPESAPVPIASGGGLPSGGSDSKNVGTDGGLGGRAGSPPAQIIEKVVEKKIPFQWTNPELLKVLAIALGLGLLLGLMGGIFLGKLIFKRKPTSET